MKNAERASATRARLIAVARRMFGEQGYAGTATEAVLQEAGVARGAMYHHFADKAALFEAVCLAVCEDIVPAVERAADARRDPLDALVQGSIRWIEKTSEPEARRILMIDAPTVLGWARWQALDDRLSQASLAEGMQAAIAAGAIRLDCRLELAVAMMNGALNALALRVNAPQAPVPPREWRRAVRALWAAHAV
ncbi:MAG: TetR/AcrR family transcriptional regulator [Comamonadaceae bacterium]|jgi:AcrR family transcriptional regulator|uniref:TetR/AcrR family transcriptional regulator n=1 Tax=Hydrogenophaga borbori TaxID=2294117 RepID=A0A372EKF7_9BURK|nr:MULTISPECIES: TetR/AcrR family transcriptional regulator [Hydrogenophaga]NCT97821.1 TetR/AcrR family transcriptional regulator [Comamonadaceae bacterium]RFP79380.1 TetR/AcrR family transcriptional regulator [Hydrogenophaga borbori]WQB84402.1 helix-turn-helix domain-containing protein [Hydrogenophaga sp. SNF1]